MSKSPFARWRGSNSNHVRRPKKGPRRSSRPSLSFEPLERRELLAVSALADFSVNEDTGEKPQSKVWEYNDAWFSVMPDSSGTWVWKLNGTQWQKQLQLTADDGYHADVKVSGNLAHILLFDGDASRLASIEYDHGVDNRYEMWSLRPSLVDVAINDSAEAAVIDIDTTGRMWVAYDTSSSIEVRYADFGAQFTNWSGPVTVATGIKSDDIGSLTAMPGGRIGVMWSNQNSQRSVSASTSTGPPPARGSIPKSRPVSPPRAKAPAWPTTTLTWRWRPTARCMPPSRLATIARGIRGSASLVRRSSGVWDNLYQVDSIGTRPS